MIRVLALAIIMFALSSFAIAHAKDDTPIHNFSEFQKENMNFACKYSYKMDIQHEDLCYIFAGLMWLESSAGVAKSGGKGHHAYGAFQNYLPTVRNRFKQKGLNYSDKEIVELLMDRNFSATMAEEELNDWFRVRKGDLFKTLASYNAGWKWQNGRSYANNVMKKAEYLKKHGTFLEVW